MAISVGWVGNGRQFTADIGSDTVTIVKYRGSGGTPSAAAADGSKEGVTSLTVTVNKTGIAMFVALPVALDFTTTELDEYVYVWGKFLAASILANVADVDGGFGVCMSSGAPTTANYSLFSQYGADRPPKDWVRMAQDPTKTRSAGSGTLNTANITHIGVFANVGTTTARFDNLLLDACDVGTGLKVTGTTTAAGLVADLLVNEAANAYGIVVPLNDSESASELLGKLTLDNDGTAAVLNDEDSKLFVGEPLYYNAASVAAMPLDFAGIEVVDTGASTTSVTIGKAVGTDNGRNGMALVGNDTYNVTFDRDDGSVTASDLYGCSLESLTGTLALDGTHDFNGETMSGCGAVGISSTVKNLTSVGSGQLTLLAGAQLQDSLIINNTAAEAVIAPTLNDVTNTGFTSDGTGNAIDLGTVDLSSAGASMSWNCQDSGYGSAQTTDATIKVNATGGGAGTRQLTINVAAGSSTPTVNNTDGDGALAINVVVGLSNLDFTVNPSITAYEWTIYEVTARGSLDGAVEVAHEESAIADNQSYSYTHAGGKVFAIQIITSNALDYVENVTYYDSLGTDQDVVIDLNKDTNN